MVSKVEQVYRRTHLLKDGRNLVERGRKYMTSEKPKNVRRLNE